MSNIYDDQYAQGWIDHSESGQDKFRPKFLLPELKQQIQSQKADARILDVGCGWGAAISNLKPQQQYIGVDITPEFFKYITENYSNPNVRLMEGSLPDLHLDQKHDLTLCALVLHCVEDLKGSIETLLEHTKVGGKLVIIDLNDGSESPLREKTFITSDEEDEHHIRGCAELHSGTIICAEVYFHKEKDYERELAKHGEFTKKELGPVFVAYELTKK